ncbi:MAG: acetyl-CoA carboxylase carboxyl transferase subunit alpha [Burkholderiales bacterium]|nr:acetyl-CoA carboxylase carboxyl transferase subunit alpha [Burkholderiales bacterium]
MKHMFLDFESALAELDGQIEALRNLQNDASVDIESQIKQLEQKSAELLADIYSRLSPWQASQVARHPQRPYTLDYIAMMTTEFQELHGDRHFADDESIVGGLARIEGEAVMIIGHQKGRDVKERTRRNFGVPIIATVIGEGGSGGALALAVADRVLMLQHATYSVISPEGCASILWRSAERAPDAAQALGINSAKLKELGLIDEIVPEPAGGAHRNAEQMAGTLKTIIKRELQRLTKLSAEQLTTVRHKKTLSYGKFKIV